MPRIPPLDFSSRAFDSDLLLQHEDLVSEKVYGQTTVTLVKILEILA